jgi:hypothetical protein
LKHWIELLLEVDPTDEAADDTGFGVLFSLDEGADLAKDPEREKELLLGLGE